MADKVCSTRMRLLTLVMVLLAGRCPVAGLDPATISAVAAAVSAGATLAGTTTSALLSGTSGTIAITVKIENFSRYPLRIPISQVRMGVVVQTPISVNPGESEVIIAEKIDYALYGSTGCASWMVDDDTCGTGSRPTARICTRIYLMWSIPYTYRHGYVNNLAVGIYQTSRDVREYSCARMHTRRDFWFKRQYYSRDIQPVEMTATNGRYKIVGMMGTGYRTQATIRFIPQNERDLANDLKQELRRHRERK